MAKKCIGVHCEHFARTPQDTFACDHKDNIDYAVVFTNIERAGKNCPLQNNDQKIPKEFLEKSKEKFLDLVNPVLFSGFNLVVKKGREWFDVTIPSDGFWIIDTDNPQGVFGYAKNITRRCMPFHFLKTEKINFDIMPESDCDSYESLLAEMQKNDPDFNEDNTVTLIWFEFEPSPINPEYDCHCCKYLDNLLYCGDCKRGTYTSTDLDYYEECLIGEE